MQKKAVVFILLAFALILFSGLVVASQQLPSSYSSMPFFEVNFDISDAPVTISQAQIIALDESNSLYGAICDNPDNNYEFICRSQVYLFNGEYSFKIVSQDGDGNEKTFTQDFIVESNPMKTWVSSPANSFYASESQDVAVKNETPFNVTFKTEYESYCKIIEGNDLFAAGFLSEEQMFVLSNAIIVDDEFSPSESSLSHRLLVVKAGDNVTDLEDKTYLEVSPFKASTFETQNSYLLLCRTGQQGDYVYHANPFYIGYDSQGIAFTTTVQPTPVFDMLDISTTQTLTTLSNDLLLCSYNFLENPSSADYQPTTANYVGQAKNIFEFSSSFDHNFAFSNTADFNPGQTYNYSINTTCYDLAGHQQSKIQDFSVHLNTTIRADLEKSYFSQKKPTITVNTNVLSYCKYVFDYDGEQYADNITLNNSLNKTHSFELPVSLSDGAYPIDIYCFAGGAYYKTFTFYIDTTKPAPPVFNSSLDSCGSDVEVNFAAPINDTVRYVININEQGNTTFLLENYTTSFTNEDYRFEFPSSVDTEINKTYVVFAYAQDRAGLNSTSSSSFSVTRRSLDYLYCDVIAPQITLDVMEQPVGYLINATCKDVGSGCTQTLFYSFVNTNESCTSFSQSSSYAMPISSSTDVKFCYQGLDVAGLQTNGSVILSDIATPFTLSQSDIGAQDISLISPRQGSSTSKTIKLEIATTYDATCAQGVFDAAHPTDKKEWMTTLDVFTQQQATSHKEIIDATTHPAFTGNTTEEFLQWVVVCGFGDDVFASKQFSLGYSEFIPDCTSDVDCGQGEYCSASGTCRASSTSTTPTNDSSVSILGIIFIILGLGLMIGGGAFIYHSRQEKSKQNQQQRRYQQTVAQQRAQQMSQKEQLARQQKYAQLLAKRKKLQEEIRSKRVQERTTSRKSLLGAFSSEESTQQKNNKNSDTIQQKETKEPKKLDIQETIQENKTKSELEKTPENMPSPTSKTFQSLSALIDKAHGEATTNTQLTKNATQVPRHITPDLFMHLFAKKIPVYASDKPALLSLLSALHRQGKLDSSDVSEVFSRLAKKGYLKTKEIEPLYKEVVGGRQ